jgi:hypothetical protein
MYPNLGAAGSHYARSVVPQHMKPANLPDPSLIFDSELCLTWLSCGQYLLRVAILARDGPAYFPTYAS